jgi:hypothetical protein
MRALLIVLVTAFCLSGPALAGDGVTPAEQAAIQEVITAQMDAFKRNDGDAALAFAAPNVKEKFGDGANFLAMVKQLYAPVARPRSVVFGAAAADGELVVQHVQLVGPDGQAATAIYEMARQPDGAWRIAGCSLIKSERLET